MSKKLVAYFSASGVTEKKAEKLAGAVGADCFRIEPEKPYSSADLNWMDKQSRSTLEMKDESARPAMKGKADVSGYDVIYIGYPIWWGVAPRIINTFIESADLAGKTIVPFATSGGSGISNSVNALTQTYPDLRIVKGSLLNGEVKGDIL